MNEPLTPQLMYDALIRFAVANGLRRQELGSGWWWSDELEEETTLGNAVEELLVEKYDIDVRAAIRGEPEEFWG